MAAAEQAEKPPLKAPPEKIEAWKDMRFGMFIHWGPVSIKGTEIGWSRGAQVPIDVYDNLYKQFNPTEFNADQWVATAKEAGMRYMIFTTKHHDGFCMFNTKQTDYNVMNSPFGRDVVKELSAACRKQGLALGTYYSVCDWHHPDFPHGSPGGTSLKPNPNLDRYEQYLRAQVEEIVRQYGPLSTLWFDVSQDFDAARGQGVVDFVRSLQPDILINNRCANPGDYDTPEQRVGTFQRKRPWESCITICHQWAWKPGDQMKSLEECVRTLARTAGGDGNLLLNVGPMPDGRIEPRQVERLRELGAWLKPRGESIYATRGGPFKPGAWGVSTFKDNRVFVHVFQWDEDGSIKLPAIPKKVLSAALLPAGTAEFTQDQEGIVLKVPAAGRDPIDTIVVLTLDGPAAEVPPVRVGFQGDALNLGKKASASNVHQNMADTYGPEMALDDDESTRWATDGGTSAAWIEVDLGAPATVCRAMIDEWAPRIQQYELQYQADGKWVTFHEGTTLGGGAKVQFPPVTAQVFRLNILKASEGPTINEFWLLPPAK